MKMVGKRPNYRRSVATREVNLFCGWEYLEKLVNQVENIIEKIKNGELKPLKRIKYDENSVLMHKAAIAIFFLTGGRAREILGTKYTKGLEVSNFRLDLDPNFIFVSGMTVLKRYKKVDYKIVTAKEIPDDTPPALTRLWHYNEATRRYERKIFITERVREYRTFYFRKDEPICKYLIEWIEKCKEIGRVKLLDGDYYYWYWFFRQLDPMRREYSAIVEWRWIYPHWFRAQRASQLAIDYGMDLHEIGDWGKWQSLEVVRQYVGTSASIRQKMLNASPSWQR